MSKKKIAIILCFLISIGSITTFYIIKKEKNVCKPPASWGIYKGKKYCLLHLEGQKTMD